MSIFCTKCGAALRNDQNFCGKCGTRVQQTLNSLEAIAAEAVASTPVGWELNASPPTAEAVTAPMPVVERVCGHGHLVPDGEKFCPVCGLMPESPPARTQTGLEIADGGTRFGAYIIDVVIYMACLFFFAMVLYAASERGADAFFDNALSSYLVYAAYLVPCWAWWGTSVGKRALKLKIVTESGAKPGFGRALVRFIVMIFLGAILGLTWWPVLWRDDNRAIHDLAAGLWVVKGTP